MDAKALRSLENLPCPSEKIYVCFLPSDVTEEDVRKMFENFGTITSFKLFRRKDGFTYSNITYETVFQAKRAIDSMNKLKISEKTLKVNFAVQNYKRKGSRIQLTTVSRKGERLKNSLKNGLNKDIKVRLNIESKMNDDKKKKKKQKKSVKKLQKAKVGSQKHGTCVKGTVENIQKDEEEQELKKQKQQKVRGQILQAMRQRSKLFDEVDEEQRTEAEWSEEFDPADLKRKPFSMGYL